MAPLRRLGGATVNTPKDGGPAFPLPPVGTGDPRDGMAGGSEGMSLRDWFAGQALNTEFCRGWVEPSQVAEQAYLMADAMLAVREKGQP